MSVCSARRCTRRVEIRLVIGQELLPAFFITRIPSLCSAFFFFALVPLALSFSAALWLAALTYFNPIYSSAYYDHFFKLRLLIQEQN